MASILARALNGTVASVTSSVDPRPNGTDTHTIVINSRCTQKQASQIAYRLASKLQRVLNNRAEANGQSVSVSATVVNGQVTFTITINKGTP